jgi:hypothetical protein
VLSTLDKAIPRAFAPLANQGCDKHARNDRHSAKQQGTWTNFLSKENAY